MLSCRTQAAPGVLEPGVRRVRCAGCSWRDHNQHGDQDQQEAHGVEGDDPCQPNPGQQNAGDRRTRDPSDLKRAARGRHHPRQLAVIDEQARKHSGGGHVERRDDPQQTSDGDQRSDGRAVRSEPDRGKSGQEEHQAVADDHDPSGPVSITDRSAAQ